MYIFLWYMFNIFSTYENVHFSDFLFYSTGISGGRVVGAPGDDEQKAGELAACLRDDLFAADRAGIGMFFQLVIFLSNFYFSSGNAYFLPLNVGCRYDRQVLVETGIGSILHVLLFCSFGRRRETSLLLSSFCIKKTNICSYMLERFCIL